MAVNIKGGRIGSMVVRGAAAVGAVALAAAVGCGSSSRQSSGPGGGGQDAMAGGQAEVGGEAGTVDLSLMDESPIEADGATLHVQGLSCPACATNVNQQLEGVSGVTSIEVNLGDGTVQVGFDGFGGKTHPSRAALARAIHDSGFTLTRIEVGR